MGAREPSVMTVAGVQALGGQGPREVALEEALGANGSPTEGNPEGGRPEMTPEQKAKTPCRFMGQL